MAAATATNVTVTVEKTVVEGKRKRSRCKIEFGNGSLEYGTTSGIPLPSYGQWGFVRFFEFLSLSDSVSTGILWNYDQSNHRLQGFRTGATGAALEQLTSAVTPAAQTLYGEAVGW